MYCLCLKKLVPSAKGIPSEGESMGGEDIAMMVVLILIWLGAHHYPPFRACHDRRDSCKANIIDMQHTYCATGASESPNEVFFIIPFVDEAVNLASLVMCPLMCGKSAKTNFS